MTVTVRPVHAGDEVRWHALWAAYCRFYETNLPAEVSRHTWARIMEGAIPVHAIVAEQPGAGIVGIANYVLHENTWTRTPVCYLEDLYVDPGHRASGVGRRLIDWLAGEMRKQGWSRLYWNTKENNYRARGLYDQYTPRDGFVRYVINNQT